MCSQGSESQPPPTISEHFEDGNSPSVFQSIFQSEHGIPYSTPAFSLDASNKLIPVQGACADATVYQESFIAVEQLENGVEKFKYKALLMQAEQDNLLMALTVTKHKYATLDAEEESSIEDSDFMQMGRIDSLIRSLSDVDVKISTYRDLHQDEALYQVNSLIDLICQVQEDEVEKEAICKRYIRLCDAYVGSSGMCVEINESSGTSVCGDFYSLITKCTANDQSRVRMRLIGLLKYIESRKKASKYSAADVGPM